MSQNSRIAIVGVGGLFPAAATLEQFWQNILQRVDPAREPPPGRWLFPSQAIHSPGEIRPDRVISCKAYFLDPFTLQLDGLNLDPELVRQLDPVFQLALEASRRAWQSAVTHTLDRRRVGVILGAIALPTESASAWSRTVRGKQIYDQSSRHYPFSESIPHRLNLQPTGLPAGLVAHALNLGGCAFTLDAACASSLYALKLAVDELISGRADAMLAGGVSRPDSLYTQMGFTQLHALSPSGRCSPFDVRGDGLVVGEGAGVFVLKRLEDAQRDGDHIFGVIVGIGLSNDIEGGLLAPASEGQLRAMQAAYQAAGWSPDEVDLIECHATGTPIGDRIELESLKKLWQGLTAQPGQCVLSAVKSSVGHLLTAAGAAALTKVLLALREETLPPTANFDSPAPGLGLEASPFRLLRSPQPWRRPADRPRRAAISGFGFGGINAHLLLEEAPESSQLSTSAISFSVCPISPISIVALSYHLGAWSDADLLGLPGERPTSRIDSITLAAERFRIPPREVEEMLPQQSLILAVAARALEQEFLTDSERLRAGVFLGVSLDPNTANFHLRWSILRHDPDFIEAAGPPLSANRTMGALASIAASRIARTFRLGGPSFTVSSTETSGLTALHLAVEALRRGELEVALVGAVDLVHDPRVEQALGEAVPRCDAAVALILRRGSEGVARLDSITLDHTGHVSSVYGKSDPLVGHCGAATGLVSLLRHCLSLKYDLCLGSRGPRYWFASEPRSLTVVSTGTDGSRGKVTLCQGSGRALLAKPRRLGFFAVEGATPTELLARLTELQRWLASRSEPTIDALTRAWLSDDWRPTWSGLALVLTPRDRAEFDELFRRGREHLHQSPGQPLALEHLYYTPMPLGLAAQVALVYPGSGSDFPDMGREIGLYWPELLQRQETENHHLEQQYLPQLLWEQGQRELTVEERIFCQVAVGTLITDLLTGPLGLQPQAALGYSLGESSMLFGLRVWRDRDGMLQRIRESGLFRTSLAGPCDAVRTVWGLSAGELVDWRTCVVARSADQVRAALTGLSRVYLQIINSPNECVVGGERSAVEELARRLGVAPVPVPETTTMHCEVVHPVARPYRELHRLTTFPLDKVQFYSAGLGRVMALDSESIADAILHQALHTIDFPTVVESAYQDGVRIFVEVGPGGSCSRLIDAILGERPHLARSACLPSSDSLAALWRLMAQLVVERVPVSLHGLYGLQTPPMPLAIPAASLVRTASLPCSNTSSLEPQLARAVAIQSAQSEAHAAYLRFDQSLQRTFTEVIGFQSRLVELILQGAKLTETVPAAAVSSPVPVVLDRRQCLEFATGKIANVLGADFAEVDTFPTRVRLPDEPLMLVDRILTIEGEPRSLTRGRVVTEHDVLPGAWYLDNNRIPTCLAVESGQADLFLSGYLGIDFRTRGLAVYRLLDAVVTFHRGLPTPGETIRYDIHIDRFFRQGETYLFRFRFVGTVNGEPLLTMTDGIAGFFSEQELASGKGVVQTELQLRPRPGIEPQAEPFLPPMQVESYSDEQVDALRRGEYAACFGPRFARLSLREPARLPSGRMRLVHRVPVLEPRGGRFGIGRIVGEADIHPDDWFLTCHFVDDQVMPGTLMYECCLHTLRIFLMRLGWVGEHSEVVCEPVSGVASRLKCRGQVTAATSKVTYEVILKERGYRPEPFVICDALMYADGKAIVEITDMSLRLSGLSRERLAELWTAAHEQSVALFERHHILAFARGNPSEAFGDRYLPFDDKFIARLPGPPYCFLDRIVRLNAPPWIMQPGGTVEAEYDVPTEEWYFTQERVGIMPFAVLLEIPLQVCGWMSAYMGSALTSEQALHYRNLGGDATLLRVVTPETGTLTSAIRCTRVASSGGMIIQDFEFQVRDRFDVLYQGSTTFGFFSRQALAQQIGLREATPFVPSESGPSFDYPTDPPYPDSMLRMLDRIDCLLLEGGPHGLGFIEGSKQVCPEEWFFEAHFYQDPVMPGSLGLEALLQLLKVFAVTRWGKCAAFSTNLGRHRWIYRGQVIPSNQRLRVQASITQRDDAQRRLVADGYLAVDGLVIYGMTDFSLAMHG